MSLPYHVWYRLVQAKKILAAEVPSSDPERRAWIGVYPLKSPKQGYNVRFFEVEKRLLDMGYDIAENELLNGEMIHVDDEDELEAVLQRWLNNLESLVGPSFADYPI